MSEPPRKTEYKPDADKALNRCGECYIRDRKLLNEIGTHIFHNQNKMEIKLEKETGYTINKNEIERDLEEDVNCVKEVVEDKE